MMDEKKEYVVSFHAYVLHSMTLKPKWYQFWRKSEYVEYMDWRRYSMAVNYAEGSLLLNSQLHDPVWTLLYKALAGAGVDNIDRVQLEDATGVAGRIKNHVPSEYVKANQEDK